MECIASNGRVLPEGEMKGHVHQRTGSAAGLESLEKVWNFIFRFPDWKKSGKEGKSLEKFEIVLIFFNFDFELRKSASS